VDFKKSKYLIDSVKVKPKKELFLIVNMRLQSFAHNELFQNSH